METWGPILRGGAGKVLDVDDKEEMEAPATEVVVKRTAGSGTEMVETVPAVCGVDDS